MKTAGIIAEYNPFHNGHRFHIEETRRQTGADYVIAVISGDFVQRGAPALLSKYDRARMALLHGADLVFSLPVTTALSSAEGFAAGGVSLLAGLGVVDVLSFGCESAASDPALFQEIAAILADEPSEYREELSRLLKEGRSFPDARELAVLSSMQSHAPAGDGGLTVPAPMQDHAPAKDSRQATAGEGETAVRRLLSEPNNILALEYAKAVRKSDSSMELCMIPRQGSSYHSDNLPGNGNLLSDLRESSHIGRRLSDPQEISPNGDGLSNPEKIFSFGDEPENKYASASAIRKYLLSCANQDPFAASGLHNLSGSSSNGCPVNPYPFAASGLRDAVPADVLQTLERAQQNRQFLSENDFSDLLYYALATNRDHLEAFGTASPDLAHRTANLLEQYENWIRFTALLKSRNQTWTAVSRYLTHVLLQIRREDFALAPKYGRAPFARLLGFRKSAAPLLKAIRVHSDIPVLTQLARDAASLNMGQKRLLDLDIRSTEIRNRILYTKSGGRLKSEYRQSTIRLP